MNEQMYVLVESTYYLRGCPEIRYGIALVERNDPIDIIIQTICDVSTERWLVEKIVARCNKIQPNKDRFKELIEICIG